MAPTARRVASALLAVLACAGCQPASRAGTAAAVADSGAPSIADAPRKRPADTVILGEATYRERIKMPPGASLHVELVALDGPSPTVVASARKPDVAGPPIPFSLPYDAARVDAAGRYGLRAELVGPDGERWFATPGPVPLVPGSGMSVEVLLQRSAGDAPSSTGMSTATAMHHWECGDLGVMSRHPAGASSVRLDANGRTWTLPLARSASGARYADGAGAEFWTKAAAATLTLEGEPPRECVQARQPSPWNTALLRGVAFRAVGNEPGWYVEVDRGASPALRATLDYGERTLALARITPRNGGFEGASGGDAVVLDIERTACADGMSGQRFEATATLRVGSRTYEGCGAFLGD